nr:restriction endonuclease subunit S [Dubosiella newyorkensis]
MSGYFLLSAKNLKNGKVMMSHDEREITKEDYALIEKSFKIQKGDVLLSIVGTIGEVVEVQNTLNMVFQRSVAMIRPRKSIISSRFLSYALAISNFKKYLIEHQSVSAQPGIYLGDLLKAHIIFPSLSEQQRIGQFFKDLDTLITLHQYKSQ